ncbi:MAG TPA: ATP-binding protein [Kofleriaceae bacterium]|jgi:nitrogen fixation/metabolism regulation signal transduction histidine kinase|nr:ATP-binding protein [Kofleriaceae bacterium]
MRLRGRFTLWFAIAALVPIAVAALVTREVVARSARNEHLRTRGAAEQAMRSELSRFEARVAASASALARRKNPYSGILLSDLITGRGTLDAEARRHLRESSPQVMEALDLAVLVVTGDGDEVLAAPHDRAEVGETSREPRRLAGRDGAVIYRFEKVMGARSMETTLVAEAAGIARDAGQQVAILVGRRVDHDLVASVRRTGQIDARVVDADGRELVPPAEPSWAGLRSPTMRIALAGADGSPVAWVEVAVWDRDLTQLLREVTLVSAVLAALALALTILLGSLVARRIGRGLDQLVTGAQAAAKGELDHRVPVTSSDEIGQVGSAFNLMMEDLRDAEERLVIAERIAAWQEIARRLAHEIKNPLTPIQMAMDTLRKTWRKQHPSFGEILEESTATVLEEADRLKRIVSEFSDFARMPKPDVHPADLNEIVAGALTLYQGATPVERRLSRPLPLLEVDKGQMTQVLLNLVENARDAIAGKDDGRILVSTRKGDAGDRVELAVEDNGPGVPPELRDRVFTPYFTTKEGKGGTGLGLAIVHRIISDHGGRIVVGEAPGGGARMVVELPLRPGQPLLASRV